MDTTEKVKSRWTRSFFTALNTRGDEERYICSICHKDLANPSNLTLHRSTHVIERRYKCEPCQVSFHSQGHLQKHNRSSSHEARVEMTQAFGIPNSDNPRPYGCQECDTAFRKHGHLAKHLRSKSHIKKLEQNGLVPMGTYAALEKAGQDWRDILVTTNCEQSLISLRNIAMQMFQQSTQQADMAMSNASNSPTSNSGSSMAQPMSSNMQPMSMDPFQASHNLTTDGNHHQQPHHIQLQQQLQPQSHLHHNNQSMFSTPPISSTTSHLPILSSSIGTSASTCDMEGGLAPLATSSATSGYCLGDCTPSPPLSARLQQQPLQVSPFQGPPLAQTSPHPSMMMQSPPPPQISPTPLASMHPHHHVPGPMMQPQVSSHPHTMMMSQPSTAPAPYPMMISPQSRFASQ